ncbi:MAG: hypothetical protein JWP97_3352 [Labilithrix sp.]|nr:hypothetical protein [Labilithrix sp.]
MLRVAGIEKAFGSQPVLRGIDLEVAAGEVHALLGENGAGKSTLVRILLGIAQADRGAMLLGGTPYAPRDAGAARAAGVVMVPQERTLCPHLTVTENIVLGIEPTGPGGLLRRGEERERARRATALVAGEGRLRLDARAGDLGVADQQLVEIARALAQGTAARVLVLDEPTASLGHDDATRLFQRVAALRATGLAVVLVTHFLGDVRAHADRYTVLRDGKVQGQGDARTTEASVLVEAMLGPARQALAARPASASGAGEPAGASGLVRRGEVLGIAGLVGSGRTSLLRATLTAERKAGTRIGMLSEDRGGEGLMLARSIADNVALSPRGSWRVSPRAELAEAARWIGELAIKSRGPAQPAGELSGGNQQKVQIARLLREDHEVLLVDEPTRGVDVASKAQILSLLRDLAGRGKAVVLVSSQLEELVSTCDRIALLKDGRLGEPRPATDWDEQSLLLEVAS